MYIENREIVEENKRNHHCHYREAKIVDILINSVIPVETGI